MQTSRLKYTKEKVKDFYDYYNQRHNFYETAKHFNVTYRDVLHYMIYYEFYTPKKKYPNVKNYCICEDFFENIDTNDKAYFLGLLMSDGSIHSELYNKKVSIALKSSDKYILDKLNNYVSPDKIVSKYKNSYKWSVSSSKMYNDLKKYGIVEKKSYAEYCYPNILNKFDSDFIRGYFDGDGCITIKSTGYNVISFCSNSKTFLTDLSNKLNLYGIKTRPINASNKNRKNTLYTLYISGGKNKSEFKALLYNDASTYLTRKYDKFKGIPC